MLELLALYILIGLGLFNALLIADAFGLLPHGGLFQIEDAVLPSVAWPAFIVAEAVGAFSRARRWVRAKLAR